MAKSTNQNAATKYTLATFRHDNEIASRIGDDGDKKRDQSEGHFARNIIVAASAGILFADGRAITVDMLSNLGGMIAGDKNAQKDNEYLSEVRTAVAHAGIINPNEGIKPTEMTDKMRKGEREYRTALQRIRRAFDSAALLCYRNIAPEQFIDGFWTVPADMLLKPKGEKISDAKYSDNSMVKLDNSDSMLVSYRNKNGPANKVVRFSYAALKAAIIEPKSGGGKGAMSLDRSLAFINKLKPEQYTSIAANEHLRPLVEAALLVLTGIKHEIDAFDRAKTWQPVTATEPTRKSA